MSTQEAVDVLSVLDCAAETLDREADGSAGLREARAAVAELIEANVELAAANADPAHTLGRDLRVITAEKRLAAAFARLQGGAA